MTGASTVSETLIAQIGFPKLAAASRINFVIFGSLLFCVFAIGTANGQTPHDKTGISRLVGEWTGESLCTNKEKFPACKDEHVVYHVVLTPNKADMVTIKADKIVDGKAEFMGENDFVWDPKKRTLVSEFKNSRVHLTLEFVVNADVMEGIIATLPERTIARNIKVKREK